MINKTDLKDQIIRILIFKRLYYKNQKKIMLTNSLYSKKQLTKKNIEEYLKRIFTLIRRDEIKKIEKKIMSDYEKINERTIRVI